LKQENSLKTEIETNIEKCGHMMCHKATQENVPAAEGKEV
jgi:hypothetical protein